MRLPSTITIDDMTVFVAVVRSGGFTAAARALHMQKAQVSRVVSRLEQRLGARLLQRSTRSLGPTEVGREFFERAANILSAVEETQAAVQHAQSEPQGMLRLTCGVEFGLQVVNHWIRRYLTRYPQMRVQADFTDRLADLIQEGFDLAVRVGTLPDSSLSARSLGEIHYALYAGPDYLARRGTPRHPRELVSHELIMFTLDAQNLWRLGNDAERVDVGGTGRLLVNNHAAARDAILDGLGIGLLPRFQASPFLPAGKLVEVLPGWTRGPAPVNAVFPSSRYLSPKVRAFIDLAVAEPIIDR